MYLLNACVLLGIQLFQQNFFTSLHSPAHASMDEMIENTTWIKAISSFHTISRVPNAEAQFNNV